MTYHDYDYSNYDPEDDPYYEIDGWGELGEDLLLDDTEEYDESLW